MISLRQILLQAQGSARAVGHFNVSDLVLVKAVFAAAHGLHVPVIVGASQGERDFFGIRQLAALIRSLREEFEYPIFLNADHTHSLPKALEAAKAGFDAVVFDQSTLTFEENIRQTRQAVEALKSVNPAILVEGEIGDIGTGSEIHAQAPAAARVLTTVEEARQFVQATGVDILAPAVGTSHGMLRSMVCGHTRKHLSIERIRELKTATGIFMTLHGASGTDDEDLKRCLAAGITIVHINTELRLAWRRGFDAALAGDAAEVVPYKLLPPVVSEVQQVVENRLKLFNHLS